MTEKTAIKPMGTRAVDAAIKACPAGSGAYVVSTSGMAYAPKYSPRGGVFDVFYLRGANLESIGADRWTGNHVGNVNGVAITGLHGATCWADNQRAANDGRTVYVNADGVKPAKVASKAPAAKSAKAPAAKAAKAKAKASKPAAKAKATNPNAVITSKAA